jgi:carbon-monoxide dehydrogenase small subunit
MNETLQGSEDALLCTTVNGEAVRRPVRVRQHLADFLRNDLGLTGTHLGCEHGVCGSCTVVLDGQVVRGCLTLAVQAEGCSVETIEGLTDNGELKALQQAFIRHNASQCGFCTAGMLLTARELLATGDPLDRAQVRDHISGNFCRCTGYQSIVEAILEVANQPKPVAR